MHLVECPQCQTQLSVEDPTYTRVICTHCREIVDIQPPASPRTKPSGTMTRASSPRNAAIPRTGSGPRHAASKTKPKAQGHEAFIIPAAVAAILIFSIGAFALTRSRSTTEATVRDTTTTPNNDTKRIAFTTGSPESKAPPIETTPTPKPQLPPETRRAVEPAPTPASDDVRPASEPTPTPATPSPTEKSAAPAANAPTPPAPSAPAAVPAPEAAPVKDVSELLKAPAVRDQKRDDDEAVLEKEDAARAKAMSDKAAGIEPKSKDELRSKLTGTDEPAAPVAPPKSLASKTGLPSSTPVPAPAKALDVAELAPVCATCLGTGFTPFGTPRHLVRGVKDPPPPNPMLAPWKQCAKCKAGMDDTGLADAEASRMKDPATGAAADNWTQMAGGNLSSVETRHITFRSQLAPAQSKVVADMLEQLTEHLQMITRVTVLTPTRPGTHELFLFTDRGAYEKVRDAVAPNPNIDRAALSKISGMSGRNKSLFHVQPPQKPEHMGLFLMGRMSMTEASNAKAPFWLVEGFAAYCENTITKKNLCYTISYELNDIKFTPNWNDDVRKFALKKQLKPWKDVFFASGVGMKPLEYLTCYSMVSFLIKSDPQRFTKLVLAVREGHPSPVALKLAYGRSVEDLQNMWAAWALTAK